TNTLTLAIDFRFAVFSPLELTIPLKYMALPLDLLKISVLVMWKRLSNPSVLILSINSGIMERCADVSVFLRNNIVLSSSRINRHRRVLTEYDFPDPRQRPPVTK